MAKANTAEQVSNDTALAVNEQQYGYLAVAELAANMSDNPDTDGLELRPDKITMVSGGANLYAFPAGDGTSVKVPEWSAVVLFNTPTRCFYEREYDGQKVPPDCYSRDAKRSVDGKQCAGCPYAQWGSGRNDGQACQQRRELYILQEGNAMPMRFSVPSTSVSSWQSYVQTALLPKGLRSDRVVTRFSAKTALNKKKIEYSQAVFAIDRILTPEERAALEPLMQWAREAAKTASVSADDVIVADDEYVLSDSDAPPLNAGFVECTP